MEHYYSKSPQVASNEQTILAKIRDKDWTLYTDAGVFSKSGIDFGTRLLIETVDINDGDDILDLGCGYGVVGIVLGYDIPNGSVTFADINERAVELAKKNAQHYKLMNTNFIISDGFAKLHGRKFDHIILNPPIRAGKSTIYKLFDEAKTHLQQSGVFWIVIHKKHGADSALKKLAISYKNAEIVNKKSGYQIIKCYDS